LELETAGRFSEAEPLYQQALAIAKKPHAVDGQDRKGLRGPSQPPGRSAFVREGCSLLTLPLLETAECRHAGKND
jgi:hypothetical protein